MGERNICLSTCTYVNTPPTLVLNLPITPHAIPQLLLCKHIDWSRASKSQDQRKPPLFAVYNSNTSRHAMGRATNYLFSRAIATQRAYVQYVALVSSCIKTKNRILSTMIHVPLSILVSTHMSAFTFTSHPQSFPELCRVLQRILKGHKLPLKQEHC